MKPMKPWKDDQYLYRFTEGGWTYLMAPDMSFVKIPAHILEGVRYDTGEYTIHVHAVDAEDDPAIHDYLTGDRC